MHRSHRMPFPKSHLNVLTEGAFCTRNSINSGAHASVVLAVNVIPSQLASESTGATGRDGVDVILHQTGNITQLAQQLTRLVTDVNERHRMRQSLSRPRQCWDNAVAESWFSTLKVELIYPGSWATRARARQAIFEYIERFYNRRRLHSSLGYLSPIEYEARRVHESTAAEAA
jgi:hypothetical protein